MQKKTVIIVAGGSGLRMGAEVPKQFLLLAGKPVLMHTITQFFFFDSSISIVLVLPEAYLHRWQQLCEEYQFAVPHCVVVGGETRFQSVKNALSNLPSTELIAVHDGVRPLVSQNVIARCFAVATQYGSAVPAIPVVDSLRRKEENTTCNISRENLFAVQTPQVFCADWLLQAYEKPYNSTYTDDASVVEAAGFSIQLTEGNRENNKITTLLDLQIAEFLLSNNLLETN